MAYHEFTIRIPNLFRDTLIQRLTSKGCLGVIEHDNAIIAYFPETTDSSTIAKELAILKEFLKKAQRDFELTFDHSIIPDQDWNESWKKGFTALDVGERFTILPPWEEKRIGRINLIIDPGMAFGTGHHETTRSCLALMEKYAGKNAKDRFLDLGSGTGLLAIAASKLGYERVVALDIDPLAVEAAVKNVALNRVENMLIKAGSITDAEGTFDCIAANIISGVLAFLAPEISSRLNPSGMTILSGILAEQADEVIKAYERTGLKLIESLPDDKWVSLVFVK
jgi:ribosomal protein L11 methyltransferase